MDEKLLGKCGYYCGQCPSFTAGECSGCIKGNPDGVCYTRDCVLDKGILSCGLCQEFPCDPNHHARCIYEIVNGIAKMTNGFNIGPDVKSNIFLFFINTRPNTPQPGIHSTPSCGLLRGM